MNFGEKLKSVRREKKLTQKALGELCGIAESTIRQYELGRLHPKFETKKKIATAMNIDVLSFLDL